MNAMKLFPNNEKLQDVACGAVRVLATSLPNAELLVDWDIGLLILAAMRTHRNSVRVQKSACAAIWALLVLSAENREKLWKVGLAHFTIEAMRNHQGAERLQEYGSGALWTFKYQYSMMHLGTSEVALASMERWSTNTRIVEHGCGIIRNLAAIQVNAYGLVLQLAPQTIVTVLPKHINNPRIQKRGCEAIWSLSFWNENKGELMRQGVAELVVNIIKRYKTDFSVFENAVGVVANLSTNQSCAEKLFRLSAGESIISGALMNIKHENSQETAICALKNIAFWDDSYAAFYRDKGATRVVEQAMANFPNNTNIIKQGEKLLQRLGMNHNRYGGDFPL